MGALRQLTVTEQGGLLFVTIFGVLTVEIWLWAACYLALGIAAEFETALYFSTATFATVGYGDIVAGEDWRLLTALEGINGFILIGWSTVTPLGTWMNTPSVHSASFRATNGSSAETSDPRCRLTRSVCCSIASASGITVTSSLTPSVVAPAGEAE